MFEKEYLSDLYYKGKATDKKHRFQPEVIRIVKPLQIKSSWVI